MLCKPLQARATQSFNQRKDHKQGLAFSMINLCYYPMKERKAKATRYSQVFETRHFGSYAEIQRPRMANSGPRQMSLQPRT